MSEPVQVTRKPPPLSAVTEEAPPATVVPTVNWLPLGLPLAVKCSPNTVLPSVQVTR